MESICNRNKKKLASKTSSEAKAVPIKSNILNNNIKESREVSDPEVLPGDLGKNSNKEDLETIKINHLNANPLKAQRPSSYAEDVRTKTKFISNKNSSNAPERKISDNPKGSGGNLIGNPSSPPELIIDIDRKELEIHASKPTNDINSKVSEESFRYTSLIKKDIDFKRIAKNIDEYLDSDEIPHEKLRITLKIMNDLIEEEAQNNTNTKLFGEKFFSLTERHYSKLCEIFEKKNQISKPLIKLLQVFDLMVEKFIDEKQKKYFVDRMYKSLSEEKMLIMDWRFLRKLCEQREGEKLEILPSLRTALVQGFLKKIKKTKRALLWKNETERVKYASEMIIFILTLSEETLFSFLLMGRFDKEKSGIKESFSMIVGDEGGLFLLINKVPPDSRQEKFILEAGVSEEFLTEKRKAKNKVILGKGKFGKVRLALSISGSLTVDIGQLVCVKKSLAIGAQESEETNLLKNITESTLEDFFARKLNESIYSPRPLDMAILRSELNNKKHRKGYLFMELVPENTADKIFSKKEYQKWEYQKPYLLSVMKTTNELLFKERIFNSDLKLPNTLFDVLSRKMAIIDLGSSLLINEKQNLENFDASDGGFGVSEPYCPPEINDDNQRGNLNLKKASSYLCGITMAAVTCGMIAVKKAKKDRNWNLTAENTDLDDDSKKSLIAIIGALTEKIPFSRMDLSAAIEKIENIGTNANEIMKKATSEQYVEKIRKLLKENNPSLLSLNEDINETKKKGIIKQMVVERNPKRFKNQKTQEIDKEFDDFMNNNEKGDDEKLFVFLGEAGSGKSLALQLRFIKEIEEWEYGKNALPLFFNMANEVDLEKVMARLNAILGCNITLEDPNNEEIHLFIDSYDEGHPGEDKNSEERQEGRIERKKESEKKALIIEQYLGKLSKWSRRKILISCRTDFVQREGEDDLSEFQAQNLKSICVRYIAPINYDKALERVIERSNDDREEFDNNDDREEIRDSDFWLEVAEWLKREDSNTNLEEAIRRIKKLNVKGRMRTGLMFNMIMKTVVNMQNENLMDLRLKGLEVYHRTIREEYKENWEKVVNARANGDCNSYKGKEQLNAINVEIQKRANVKYEDNEKKYKVNNMEGIWESMERIGELIAADMSLKKSNRIRYSEVEILVGKKKEFGYDSNERTEWKTLYQILRIMGLKLEKRRNFLSIDEDQEQGKKKNNRKDENEIIIDIGFRHETYKNYYLLRGVKRLLPVVIREREMTMHEKNLKANAIPHEDFEENKSRRMLIAALLEDEGVNSNYGLLRFCGEEILNYKDPSLRNGLRKLLDLEQINCKKWNTELGEKSTRISKSAAVIMSLLVAGSYQFWGEDLSDLDLAGAYMRGGVFCKSKFERTNLRNANLQHANLSEACFINADMRDIELGIWPDLIGHEKGVTSVCISPDGKRLASGSKDFSVKIWDLASGECLLTLAEHGKEVTSVNFSPDGKRLASGSGDNSVKIWDSTSGLCIQTLEHSDIVNSVSFSPNGDMLASAGLAGVKIWDCASGKCVLLLAGHNANSVCFSLNGKRVASAIDDNTVKIWDRESGKCVQMLAGDFKKIISACYSPDCKWLASGVIQELLTQSANLVIISIKIWDSASGECIQTFATDYNFAIFALCFSPAGKQLASAGDNSVKVWDIASGQCLHTFAHSAVIFSSVCFSPDGRRIACGSSENDNYDNSVKFWDIASGECVQALEGHTNLVRSLCFSPKGDRLASASMDKTVKIWDSTSGECLQTLEHSDIVMSVRYSPDGKIFASGGGFVAVKIWDSSSGECIQTLTGHEFGVNSVCFGPDGMRLASASSDKSIKIWNTSSGECLQTLLGHSGFVSSVCFSPDGKTLVSGSETNEAEEVKIWDSTSGECIHTLLGHSSIREVCFSPDGKRLLSSSKKCTIKIWDFESRDCLQTLTGISSCFNPDGKILAIAEFLSVNILDAASGECLQKFDSTIAISICFSPDGKKIAHPNFKSVKIWDSISEKGIGANKVIPDANDYFERGKNSRYLMRMSLSSEEEIFRCDSCTILNCKMGDSESDQRNRNAIVQRKGKIYNK